MLNAKIFTVFDENALSSPIPSNFKLEVWHVAFNYFLNVPYVSYI